MLDNRRGLSATSLATATLILADAPGSNACHWPNAVLGKDFAALQPWREWDHSGSDANLSGGKEERFWLSCPVPLQPGLMKWTSTPCLTPAIVHPWEDSETHCSDYAWGALSAAAKENGLVYQAEGWGRPEDSIPGMTVNGPALCCRSPQSSRRRH
jgi:hypothetical protein